MTCYEQQDNNRKHFARSTKFELSGLRLLALGYANDADIV